MDASILLRRLDREPPFFSLLIDRRNADQLSMEVLSGEAPAVDMDQWIPTFLQSSEKETQWAGRDQGTRYRVVKEPLTDLQVLLAFYTL